MDKKAVKRSRDKQLIFRFSEKEIEKINKKLEQAKTKNRSDFFLLCLDNKPIIEIDGLHELMAELKRIGNNINQIAMKTNAQREAQQAKETLEEIHKTCTIIQGFLNDVTIQSEKKSGTRNKKRSSDGETVPAPQVVSTENVSENEQTSDTSLLLPRPAISVGTADEEQETIIPDVPLCPKCKKPMIRRKSYKGEFWGCSDYFNTKCDGLRPIEEVHNADIQGTSEQSDIK
jgi:hypothetical protein